MVLGVLGAMSIERSQLHLCSSGDLFNIVFLSLQPSGISGQVLAGTKISDDWRERETMLTWSSLRAGTGRDRDLRRLEREGDYVNVE